MLQACGTGLMEKLGDPVSSKTVIVCITFWLGVMFIMRPYRKMRAKQV